MNTVANQVASHTDPTNKQNSKYEYVVEFHASIDAMQRNESISTARLDVDWDPALQSTGFQAIRDEKSDRLLFGNNYEVQPRWDQSLGPPYVEGVLVDGRAVRGLTRDNFELLVDGEPQELSWFEAIELDEPPSGAPRNVGGEPAGSTRRAPSAGWRRHYLVLFDFGFSSRYRVQHAVQGIRRMVETQSQLTDRFAIALFAEAVGARMLVPFTSDRRGIELGLQFLESLADAKPRKSIDRLEALDGWWSESFDRESLPRPLLADMGSHASTLIQPLVNPPEPAGIGLPIALDDPEREESSDMYSIARVNSILGVGGGSLSTVRSLGRSMASLVTLLRDVPEPKHLLFLSQGLGGLFGDTETMTPVLHRLKPMLDAFGDTGWTLQAISIGGIPAPPSSVSTRPEDYNGSAEVGLSRTATAGSDGASLFYLANETGGELFENYNRIHQATEKILDRTQATYLLAFQPTEIAADGQRYEIEVRLTPKIQNARVLHRPGFRAPRPPTERLMPERRMDAAELALSGGRLDELEVRVMPVVLPAATGARVPVFVEVDTDRLDAGKKGRKRVRLDIHGYALDEAGNVRAGFSRELRFHLQGERVVSLRHEISLPTGTHELRLLAWDLRGGRRHLSDLPIEVGAEGSAGSLSGPFFLASTTARRQFAPKGVEPRDGLALFELEDELDGFDLEPAITRDRSRRFLVLAPTWPESGAAELHLSLLSDDGRVMAGEVEFKRLEDGADGTARFAGLLETAGLAAGSYRLEATREDASGTKAISATPFELVEPDRSQSR